MTPKEKLFLQYLWSVQLLIDELQEQSIYVIEKNRDAYAPVSLTQLACNIRSGLLSESIRIQKIFARFGYFPKEAEETIKDLEEEL